MATIVLANTFEACLCRAEFCYLCAAPWKTCACPVWNEDRLLDRANVVVARNFADFGFRVARGEELVELVEQARQLLVNNNECQHGSWKRIKGPQTCEECGERMPKWIRMCRQCRLLVCQRCKLNRL